jgi:hypothetical protein
MKPVFTQEQIQAAIDEAYERYRHEVPIPDDAEGISEVFGCAFTCGVRWALERSVELLQTENKLAIN